MVTSCAYVEPLARAASRRLRFDSTAAPSLRVAAGWPTLACLLLVLLARVAHAQRPQLSLGLLPQGGTDADSATVYFQPGATVGFDIDFDASKLPNSTGLNLASITVDGQQLTTNGLPPSLLSSPLTIPLSVSGPADGAYTLQVGRLANFSTTAIYLTDALQQTNTRLAPGTRYAFELTATTTGGTPATATRFALQFVPGGPLPVVLTFFTAQAQPRGVQLSWGTASEVHSAYFGVERSSDGVRFIGVGTVAAAGTSAATHSYNFTDTSAPGGLLYYRLHQVDLDGTATYSPVRLVTQPNETAGLTVYPNPTRAVATLRGAGPGATVQVLDALGRTVATATADATGETRLAASLPVGVYVVRSSGRTVRLSIE
jgi:hypothetical protein